MAMVTGAVRIGRHAIGPCSRGLRLLGWSSWGRKHPSGDGAEKPREHEPADSRNVVTFYPPGRNPATAIHQLDFAFASRGFHESLSVRAMNGVDEWGASDHCRLQIEIEGGVAPAAIS